MDVNECASRKVTFFIIPFKTHPHNDGTVRLGSSQMRGLLREINDRGHEIGVHPGFNSYQDEKIMKTSLLTFRSALAHEGINADGIGGRQHYLRWDVLITPQLYEKCGLEYDSSAAYAEVAGFRCGTCREYFLYDFDLRRPLKLKERPLIVMECSVIDERYMGLGYTENSLNLMLNFKALCRYLKGDFTLLWHNSNLRSEMARIMYQSIISRFLLIMYGINHSTTVMAMND